MTDYRHFYNKREFITIQRNIINIKSENIYLPITPKSFTTIKIFNFSDHPFILHNNSKTDLIFNSLYIPKEGTDKLQINSNKQVELTYLFHPDKHLGKWNLTMN